MPANLRAHPLNPSFVNRKIVVSTPRRIVTRTYPDFDGGRAASKFLLTYVLNYEYRWVIGIAFWAATLIRLHEVLTRSISSRLRDATRQRLPARHLSRPVFFPRLSGALPRCT